MSGVELLARSSFSLLEGASQPEELVEAAARLGLTHLGLVDRDGVYGVVRAHQAAQRTGVALVVGATVTVRGQPPVSLLAETMAGWSSLTRLLTTARSRGPKGHAACTVGELAAAAGGLTAVLHHGWDASPARPLADAYGRHLEVALSRTLAPGDVVRAAAAESLARELRRSLLATALPLFHEPGRRPLADILTCIRRRTTLDAAGTWLQANAERHLLSGDALRTRHAAHPEAVERARVVANRCRFSLDSLAYRYPSEVIPDGATPMAHLRSLVEAGLVRRYPNSAPAPVRELVEHELSVIDELDYPHYFLTVNDIVQFARSRGILCQGRGSAANSAVCYALGITSVDPARMSVLFERFISAERGEPPDIDVDFEHERREEVIQYVYARYGRDRAALVDEVISWRWRSAVRDVGVVFGLSRDQVDRLAKHTDRWSAGDGVDLADLVREAGLDPTEPRVHQTLEWAAALRHFPRHLSIHVGGFVIAEGRLTDLVPVEPAAMDRRTVIQWDKDDVDALRFVKVDLLSLGILTAIRKSLDLVHEAYGLRHDLATIPAEDPAVYEMFSRADTVGVFQIESRAQMSMLPRLKPRCFYDLVVEVSIVRPGPIQGGMVHPYLRRRAGLDPVTYAHPDLEPILARTLGVPIFQEQVMKMASVVGGFTPGEADRLRRAMGAWRKRGGLDILGEQLVQGMLSRGISREYADAVFKQILGFGEYGFPESHAASFALLVYASGWVKGHFPEAWAAGLINSQPMGFYTPRSIVADAQRHGVRVLPVSVVASAWDCTLEDVGGSDESRVACPGSVPAGRRRHALRLGLHLVRGLGEDDAHALVAARERAPFRSLVDLAHRSGLSRDRLHLLARANACADLGVTRRQAAWVLQGLWAGLPLLAGVPRREPEPGLPVETPSETLRLDFEATGLSLGAHPVELHRVVLDAEGVLPVAELADVDTGTAVRVAGLVSHRQRPGTARGVVFMTLEDETGMTNLVLWPRVWAEHRRVARTSVLLLVEGELQRQDDAVSVLVRTVTGLDAPVAIRSRDFR